MTPLLPASALARDNEQSHQGLAHRMAAIRTALHEIGEVVATARSRRRLFGHVVALRIAQEDHLEEEECLLPVIHQRIGEAEQLDMARHLLFDSESEDEHWMLDWMAPHLTAAERRVLANLVARFAPVPPCLCSASLDASAGQDAARSSMADCEAALMGGKPSG